MSIECPECMPKHRADLAQSKAWRDEHGVRSEGWLHPSRDYPTLQHCNCCGGYYKPTRAGMLRRLSRDEVAQHREVRG